MTKADLAQQYFKEGYNCSQAVFGAFCDLFDMDKDTAMIYSSGFGGGMGRMREVCGAVSGMVMVISILYGSADPKAKSDVYKRVQEVSNKFKEQNGSIVCKELLGLTKKSEISPIAEERTKEYYKKRPCELLVYDCAQILEEYISRNPIS